MVEMITRKMLIGPNTLVLTLTLYRSKNCNQNKLAEREGFEPSKGY